EPVLAAACRPAARRSGQRRIHAESPAQRGRLVAAYAANPRHRMRPGHADARAGARDGRTRHGGRSASGVSRRARSAGRTRWTDGSDYHGQRASMSALDFPDASFDLIWSEGAIYVMGFAEGLRAWKRLLKPHGAIAVTELSWLGPDIPEEA